MHQSKNHVVGSGDSSPPGLNQSVLAERSHQNIGEDQSSGDEVYGQGQITTGQTSIHGRSNVSGDEMSIQGRSNVFDDQMSPYKQGQTTSDRMSLYSKGQPPSGPLSPYAHGEITISPKLPFHLLSKENKNIVTLTHDSMENIHSHKSLRSGDNRQVSSQISVSTPTSSASSEHHDSGLTLTLSGRTPSMMRRLTSGGEPDNNEYLYKYIEDEKRAVLLRKAVMTFLYAALIKSSEKFFQVEERRKLKEIECAARLILNTLLLNSWRNDKIQLTKILHENAQLTISVENLGLQLRVLRHLQCQEKDRANEKITEIRNLKAQVKSAQKSLKNTESDLASIRDELRYCHEDNSKLVEQKSFLHKELEELLEEKGGMTEAVDSERRRANRAEEECRMIKFEYADLRKQAKDLSSQSFQWRERSRTLESQGIEIEENLELREASLRLLESNFKVLLSEREQYKTKKESLEEIYKEAQTVMEAELKKTEELKHRLENTSETVEFQQEKLLQLERTVQILRTENQKTQQDLYWHKLKNVRSRRAWVNAVDIISSPTKLIKYLLFGQEQTG